MPETIDNFTNVQAEALKKFLAAPERPEGTMDYLTLAGFLFAVGYCPEVVMPSEWMPVVFDNEDPSYQSEQEFAEIVAAMLSLYNFVSQEAGEDKVHLPPGCHVFDDAMANFGLEAPLGRWAAGFDFGRLWLEDSWDAVLVDEMEDELNASMLVLIFFADRQFAEETYHEARNDGVSKVEDSFEEFAAGMLRVFPTAMENYAAMGLSVFQSLMKLGLYEKAFSNDEPEPGRNDPCPCGSGKKYKRCCM